MDNEKLKISMNLAKMSIGEMEEDKKLSAYWGDSAPEYQDIDNTIDKDTFLKLFMYTPSNEQDKNNVKCVSTLLNPKNWESFKNEKAEYVIGGPTLEMWISAWNATEPGKDGFVKLYSKISETFGYHFGTESETYNSAYVCMNGEINKSTIDKKELEILENKYEIFFPHTQYNKIVANGVTGNCQGYWLASPRAVNEKDPMAIGWDGVLSYCDFNDKTGRGIRPLICLKPETKLIFKGVSEDGNKIYSID